jgi:hypothetical protein
MAAHEKDLGASGEAGRREAAPHAFELTARAGYARQNFGSDGGNVVKPEAGPIGRRACHP